MKALRAAHLSAVHDQVVEDDKALHIEGPRMRGDEDADRPHPRLERIVERCDRMYRHGFLQRRRSSFASWWQMPLQSWTLIALISAFDVMLRPTAVCVTAFTRA